MLMLIISMCALDPIVSASGCDPAVARYDTQSWERPSPLLRQTFYQLECQATTHIVPCHTVPGHAHSNKQLMIQSMPRHDLPFLELANLGRMVSATIAS
jgi:hypothetical protein